MIRRVGAKWVLIAELPDSVRNDSGAPTRSNRHDHHRVVSHRKIWSITSAPVVMTGRSSRR